MAKYAVVPAGEIKPGERRIVNVGGRPLAIFNIKGEFFALLNRCPHQGASLCHGLLTGLMTSEAPGEITYSRQGEFLRCPWHGWEFDMRTGQSYFDPLHTKVRNYPTSVEDGETVIKGPYKAEIFPVAVEEDYLCVEL
ncbi:Rieske (2Fe-2S) protein [Shinella sp. BYT-45]|uniref:Rieske (2Fe-2S) protein n=1 Tax=Shinella sp. BYT-45 TaxID=3377377 RepID=UPI00397F8925